MNDDNGNRNKKEYERLKEEYKQFMLELYKENEKLLDATILGISSLAFPFLFLALKTKDVGFYPKLFLGGSLIGFFIATVLHLVAYQRAGKGCIKTLEIVNDSETAIGDGERLFDQARCCDAWRDRIFVGSLALIVIALWVGIFKTKEFAMLENKNDEKTTLRCFAKDSLSGIKPLAQKLERSRLAAKPPSQEKPSSPGDDKTKGQ